MDISTQFLQQLAAHSRDLTFVYDLDKDAFVYLSDSAAPEFLGADATGYMHTPERLLDLLHAEDKKYVLSQMNKLRKGEPYIVAEFRLQLPHNPVKWVYAKVYLLLNTTFDGRHIAGIVEDITKRKEHELSLYNIKEQKDTVLQILGHDLRSPLHTITSATELINLQLSGEPKQLVQKFLDVISLTSKSSLRLINEILKIEFLETEKVAVNNVRFDVVERIQNQIDTYLLVGEVNKQFTLKASHKEIYITTDATRSTLIIENLLSNAYKFTKPGGRIDIRVEKQGKSIVVGVADNGLGIPDALQPHIFDKFTKARRPGYRGEKPIGLGLHLVKTLVEQLEGKIWFESQEGVGTTFYVELPVELNINNRPDEQGL